MKLMSVSALSAMLVLAGCQSTTAPSSVVVQPKASAKAIEAHMTFLGDDSLEGRDTGSRGHQIASNYIATQLAGFRFRASRGTRLFSVCTYAQSFTGAKQRQNVAD